MQKEMSMEPTISEDGTVRFTFNERITSESDIHGDFSLDTHLNDSDGREYGEIG